jgi:hypothetical protein
MFVNMATTSQKLNKNWYKKENYAREFPVIQLKVNSSQAP